jgi:hypothetical protein
MAVNSVLFCQCAVIEFVIKAYSSTANIFDWLSHVYWDSFRTVSNVLILGEMLQRWLQGHFSSALQPSTKNHRHGMQQTESLMCSPQNTEAWWFGFEHKPCRRWDTEKFVVGFFFLLLMDNTKGHLWMCHHVWVSVMLPKVMILWRPNAHTGIIPPPTIQGATGFHRAGNTEHWDT